MKTLPEKCKKCYACLEVCPVQAIKKQDDGTVVIDTSLCLNCGCCAAACPVGAVIFDDD
jgi:Fe-S-cluster-containing dehydrogenase component